MSGERLRAIPKERNLFQGDIEERTGLLRCYVSRVENGHTVPSIETLEKIAGALDIPLYQIFYDGEELPAMPALPLRAKDPAEEWGLSGRWANFLRRLQALLGQMEEADRQMFLLIANRMLRRK